MGINYYVREKATESELEVLKKFGAIRKQVHIGKQSRGWSFNFHSPTVEELRGVVRGVRSIRSRLEWINVLQFEKYLEIVNEYDEVVQLGVLEATIELTKDELNHKTELMKSTRFWDVKHADEECTLDDEGFCFSIGEFC